MGRESKIKWTDATWNPWRGCEKVSDGCKYCYAEAMEKRWHNDDFGTLKRTAPATWGGPIHWNHKAEQNGKRMRVFTCSLSDFFHPQADQWRTEAWEVIRRTPHLDWMILTKRPERIAGCLPPGWDDDGGWPNVSLGVTIENQAMADKRLPILMDLPTTLKFVSAEPLLEHISLQQADADWDALNLVIVGGETGSKDRRPLYEKHMLAIKRDCDAVGVRFLFKGWNRTQPVRLGERFLESDGLAKGR